MDAEDAQRYESVDAETASSLLNSQAAVLLDVRTSEEFAAGHAPGALNIPFMIDSTDGRAHNPDFLAKVREAFPEKATTQLCVTCGGGTRGTSAAMLLVEDGYEGVMCMPGGMRAWTARGLPTTAAAKCGKVSEHSSA